MKKLIEILMNRKLVFFFVKAGLKNQPLIVVNIDTELNGVTDNYDYVMIGWRK